MYYYNNTTTMRQNTLWETTGDIGQKQVLVWRGRPFLEWFRQCKMVKRGQTKSSKKTLLLPPLSKTFFRRTIIFFHFKLRDCFCSLVVHFADTLSIFIIHGSNIIIGESHKFVRSISSLSRMLECVPLQWCGKVKCVPII